MKMRAPRCLRRPTTFWPIPFEYAVPTHNVVAFILVLNAALAVFYHLVSGEIRSEDLVYYAIFVVFMLTLVRMAVESFRWR